MELIDVSNVNGSVDWKKVRADGVTGAWLKASEGVTFTDALFAAHRRAANRAGVRVGAYHFARPDNNTAKQEADHFSDVVGKVGRRDLRPVLDYEHDTTLSARELEEWARHFNQRVVDRLGVLPAFYSYPFYIAKMHLTSPIGNGLWLADYGPNDGVRHPPKVPPPWLRCIAHQYTSKGTVRGVSGHVDRSYAPRVQGVLAHPLLGLL